MSTSPITIDRAAIKFRGVVYTLPRPNRHPDIVRHIRAVNGIGLNGPDIKGFLDSTGAFLTRSQAVPVALAAGQVLKRSTLRTSGLYSEDLWS